ncbi:MAG: CocE/NonD family hydrolase, partial [Actinomycetota bacterium]
MRIRTDLPFAVSRRDAWIPMSDGCRLSARIWLPEDAAEDPVPAILEYLPYRKSDATARRDAIRHPYVAGHGYACVRVDIRGTGDSDGILLDEYLPREQDDALEVLAWLAAQPWCTGAAGMIGISWGGFNGLQVAARRPPELKAVVTLCSTDDRYADDVHYLGGCVLGDGMLSWASTMLAYDARPPDPAAVGERWREMWMHRLESSPPFIEAWLSHQRRDDYWKQGSVCEDLGAIDCPVYAVGGWADAYPNAIPRLLKGLTCPRKGLIGPWSHLYPDQGVPGPAIGFSRECLRWWDRWLKGLDTGVTEEPMLRVWMQEWTEPRSHHATSPGRWVAEPSWPSPRVGERTLSLTGGGLSESPGPAGRLDLLGAQATGSAAGRWCHHGEPGNYPGDQREEDGRSLTFTSAPLEERVEILGYPVATLDVVCDRPQALVAVRLCDVAPTGASTLVSRGVLNLTHRDDHEHPEALEPGRRYRVRVELRAIAHSFAEGHRVRVSVSPTYWPWAWPSPEPVTLGLFTGTSNMALPVREPRAEDERLHTFEPPEGSAPLPVDVLQGHSTVTVCRDERGRHELRRESRGEGFRERGPDGLEYEADSTDVLTIVEGDPLAASVRCDRSILVGRGEWRTRVEITDRLSA